MQGVAAPRLSHFRKCIHRFLRPHCAATPAPLLPTHNSAAYEPLHQTALIDREDKATIEFIFYLFQ